MWIGDLWEYISLSRDFWIRQNNTLLKFRFKFNDDAAKITIVLSWKGINNV